MSKESATNDISEFRAKSLETRFRKTAARITEALDISNSLELLPFQVDLFMTFLTAYLIQQDTRETAYRARHPATEALLKIPLLKRLAQLEIDYVEMADRKSKAMMHEAEETSRQITQNVTEAIYEKLSKEIDKPISEIKKSEQDQIHAEQKALKILEFSGSPSFLRRSANLISTTFTQNSKEKDPNIIEKKLKDTFDRIQSNHLKTKIQIAKSFIDNA